MKLSMDAKNARKLSKHCNSVYLINRRTVEGVLGIIDMKIKHAVSEGSNLIIYSSSDEYYDLLDEVIKEVRNAGFTVKKVKVYKKNIHLEIRWRPFPKLPF
ncbi:MAG: hypothetical protein WCL06_15725 [Bacteroidota bacterium]